MMARFGRIGWLAVLVATGSARGDKAPTRAETPAVQRGLAWLKGRGPASAGEAAIAALAMVKAGVPGSDPALAAAVRTMLARIDGATYTPQAEGDHDVYEASVLAMALAGVDPEAYAPQIQALAAYIAGRQGSNGSWDYPGRTERGDTSVTQYALLGLLEAVERGHARVRPEVWDRAARWILATQQADGAWVYRPEEPGRPMGGPSVSMTAAGLGGLLICRVELADAFRSGPGMAHPLLTPVDPGEGHARFVATVGRGAVDAAVGRGLAWLSDHFRGGDGPAMGQSPYYGLYGIERVIAFAAPVHPGWRDRLAGGDSFVESTQVPDGHWDAMHGAIPNTAWAILYLIRAGKQTAGLPPKTRLGAGTLVGGRCLPRNLADLAVVGGRFVARPMDGPVAEMLKALEEPGAERAEAALAGLVDAYDRQGPRALIPQKDRFRALLTSKDPGLRRVAAWALARIGDPDVVPALIDALGDEDLGVMAEASRGLQLISRKVEGFGPPVGADAEQRRRAILRWREWFESDPAQAR